MRSIKNLNTIISLNKYKYNLILTPRGWGLTTFLIEYINKIPNDKKILFGVDNSQITSMIKDKITQQNCVVQTIHKTGLCGKRFDYIICDNFFKNHWLQKLILLGPTLKYDGKIILADSDLNQDTLSYRYEYFVNYNKIIKTTID